MASSNSNKENHHLKYDFLFAVAKNQSDMTAAEQHAKPMYGALNVALNNHPHQHRHLIDYSQFLFLDIFKTNTTARTH